MKHIPIGPGTDIDLQKLIETRLLIQANSGGGKSWLIRRLLEQTHGKVQQIVLDPEGEFGTLREKYDYILAGKGGDTPAEPRSAALLARKLLELKTSAIIDLYELPPQERKRFVRLFLEAMVNAPKELYHNVLVVIDEAHVFVPQVGESEAAGAVIDLATRGRKRGYCAVLATQRISKLHKDAAAECNNKMIGRTSQDIDMKRAADELGFSSREQIFSLRTLKPGQFYAFGPAISDEVKTTVIGPVLTSHPKAGSKIGTKVAPPTAGIRKILGALADLPKEAEEEARTVADLKQQIVQLKREKINIQPAFDAQKYTNATTSAVDKAVAAATQQHEKQIKAALKEREKEWNVVLERTNKDLRDASKALEDIAKIAGAKKYFQIPEDFFKNMPMFETKTPILDTRAYESGEGTILSSENVHEAIAKIRMIGEATTDLSGPEQKVLDAVAWMNAIGVEQPARPPIAFLAGYSNMRSTGFTNPCGALRSKGLIVYPNGATIALTDAGRELARTPNIEPTKEELQRAVLAKLPNPERRLLEPLISEYPEAITNAELSSRARYSNDHSTGYTNPRGRLRSFGLIEYTPSGVRAADLLFP